MNAHFEIISIIDNDDGSANVTLEMGIETLKIFAAIGLMHVFKEKAQEDIGDVSVPPNDTTDKS